MNALRSIPGWGYAAVTRWFVGGAVAALLAADLAVTSLHPWADLQRLLGGLIHPDLLSVEVWSVVYTIAFAILGVTLGAGAGFVLAIPFARFRSVRLLCAGLRSVHELFWALLLMQVFGLSATTGILAIALPYAGICAKVYSEIIEEADLSALRVLPEGTGALSAFAYGRLPDVAAAFRHYTLYRFECAMRSTLVLGFIGLPTMGFYLESAFRQGRYAEAGALLLVFYALIGSRRLWMRLSTLPVLLVASVLALPKTIGTTNWLASLGRFVSHDIVPSPLRSGALLDPETWARLGSLVSARSSRSRSCPARSRPWSSRRSRWWPLPSVRCSCSPWSRAGSPGRSASPSGASSSWSFARRRNTCWPTCCCSCSAPRCCRRSWR